MHFLESINTLPGPNPPALRGTLCGMPKHPDGGPKEPNLELPSFGFRRRKQAAPAPPAQEPDTPPERRERTAPSPLAKVAGPYAAVAAGVVCGVVGTVLSVGSLRGCEAVRGVGSCGGIGLFALLAILVVEIFIGAAILRGCRVDDWFSTSFLGVGVAAVVIVLFLLGYLGSWWLLIAVPVVTAAAYLFSWWVTTRFVDVRDDDRHR